MDGSFLVPGIIIGFSIAAPVGPIGILCIRRTLAAGRMSGLVSGLGAATADGLYGIIAAFGLTSVSDILVGQQFWFHLIGGVFLLALGLKIMLSVPPGTPASPGKESLLGDYVSTVFLTIANPVTILSFAAIFTGVGLGMTGENLFSPATMALGVVIGSAFWWVLLVSAVTAVRTKFSFSWMKGVNRIAGLVIVLFGCITLAGILP